MTLNYLIIPALNSHTRDDDVKHVKSWASANNLQLNCSKSHEIVFRSRRLRGKADQPASPCPNIERVDTLTVLGVEVNSSLKPRLHDTTGCQAGCTTGLTTGCIV